MKKIIFFVVFFCLFVSFAFATDFTVQSVNGRVERESGNRRVAVVAGETLNGNTVIRTTIGASLVLLDANGSTITIPAGRNGRLSDLATTVARTGGGIIRADTGVANVTTGQTSTASARASDQAGDENIADE